MIIVVSKLLFWFAIFRSDDRTIDRRVDLDHLAISRGYQSRLNRRIKQAEWTVCPIQAENLTSASVEINRVWGLNPDTTERRGIRGYMENSVSVVMVLSKAMDLTERVINQQESSQCLIIAVSKSHWSYQHC